MYLHCFRNIFGKQQTSEVSFLFCLYYNEQLKLLKMFLDNKVACMIKKGIIQHKFKRTIIEKKIEKDHSVFIKFKNKIREW